MSFFLPHGISDPSRGHGAICGDAFVKKNNLKGSNTLSTPVSDQISRDSPGLRLPPDKRRRNGRSAAKNRCHRPVAPAARKGTRGTFPGRTYPTPPPLAVTPPRTRRNSVRKGEIGNRRSVPREVAFPQLTLNLSWVPGKMPLYVAAFCIVALQTVFLKARPILGRNKCTRSAFRLPTFKLCTRRVGTEKGPKKRCRHRGLCFKTTVRQIYSCAEDNIA